MMDIHQLFAEWKGYYLPSLDNEGRYPTDWMNREFIAFKAGLERQQLAEQSKDAELTDEKLNELITKYHPKAQKGVKRFEVTDWWRFGKAVMQAMKESQG